MKKSFRIGINAQLPAHSGAGGIETVLRVLTSLNRFGGDEEYIFIGHWSDAGWLESLLGARQKLVRAPRPEMQLKPTGLENLKRLTGVLRPLARRVKRLVLPPPTTKTPPQVPVSNGFFESLGCDVIHFPYQDYVLCRNVPTVYNPHDLQHRHYPQFFAPEEIARRELIYAAACRAAQTVVVASEFVKQDVSQSYAIDAGKIQVIPWSPPEVPSVAEFTEAEAAALLKKYDCPARPFVLYPAMTWEHKNHLRLIEAVHRLRERDDLIVNVVCTGHKNSFYEALEKRLRELNLESQIQFTGIVEYKELSMFYRLAQFVVIPTLFEAASAPLFEAWQHGTPVACAVVTSLPEQAADAALLFDPHSVEAIAAALKALTVNPDLRTEYRSRGFRRLGDFSLERTMKAYRAVYRKAAGATLSAEEAELLN